jgi:Spy/CpxP family protein refolding chaperone
MKSLFRTAIFVALCAVVPAIRAADDEAPSASEPAAPRLDELAQKLNLTDEQKAQIAPILQKEAADLKALQGETSMRRMQKLRKLRDIANAASKEIRALLTPEQQTQYDEMCAEAKKKIKEAARNRSGR